MAGLESGRTPDGALIDDEETYSRESDCGPVAKAPDEPPIPYRIRASPRLYWDSSDVICIGNELIAKRVVRDREAGWLLVSENPDKKAFPIQTWPDDARAIAEVNWHGQSFRSNSEPREPNLTKCSDQRGADFRVERESVGPARTRIRIRVGRRP